MDIEDITETWDIESVFIEKVLKSLPYNFHIKDLLDNLEGPMTF